MPSRRINLTQPQPPSGGAVRRPITFTETQPYAITALEELARKPLSPVTQIAKTRKGYFVEVSNGFDRRVTRLGRDGEPNDLFDKVVLVAYLSRYYDWPYNQNTKLSDVINRLPL